MTKSGMANTSPCRCVREITVPSCLFTSSAVVTSFSVFRVTPDLRFCCILHSSKTRMAPSFCRPTREALGTVNAQPIQSTFHAVSFARPRAVLVCKARRSRRNLQTCNSLPGVFLMVKPPFSQLNARTFSRVCAGFAATSILSSVGQYQTVNMIDVMSNSSVALYFSVLWSARISLCPPVCSCGQLLLVRLQLSWADFAQRGNFFWYQVHVKCAPDLTPISEGWSANTCRKSVRAFSSSGCTESKSRAADKSANSH